MKTTPTAHILSSYANRGGMSWRKALFEWIDNSIGAQATAIHVEIRKTHVSIRDNGTGTATMEAFATLGEHVEHSRPDGISCYGVGSKDAALWIGKEKSTVSVTSMHKGITREIMINWEEMARNDWTVDDPLERPAREGELGTSILVKPVGVSVPTKARLERMLEEIGYYYRPAIKSGVQISISSPALGSRPVPATPWAPPEFEPGVIDTTITVGNRTARVFVGVVREGFSTRYRGFTYFREFRVIEAATSNGCGQYNAAHVCGFVDLDRSWRLTTNKEAIVNAEELYLAVEQASLEVLRRAETRGSMLASQELTAAVEAQVNAGLENANAKAKRGRGNKSGTKETTGKGGKHTGAQNEQPGNTFGGKPRKSGSVRICFAPLGKGKSPRIGEFKSPNITLNSDHPLVAGLISDAPNIQCLAALSLSLVAVDAAVGRQTRLPNMGDELEDASVVEKFQAMLGTLLASPTTNIDGQGVTAQAAE